ncbi:hypothetical protein PR048_030990 [Dryococelus australis]|uniref:Uncharacterized protein n=1 Tax=Dryococelus australis TaxID=614101 RepID=A0ABQ9G424_9NEOP|nr:hypothetical protein PR048_030990 [Dryococelus australis]
MLLQLTTLSAYNYTTTPLLALISSSSIAATNSNASSTDDIVSKHLNHNTTHLRTDKLTAQLPVRVRTVSRSRRSGRVLMKRYLEETNCTVYTVKGRDFIRRGNTHRVKGFPAGTRRCPSSPDMTWYETLGWSSARRQGRGNREYPEKTRRQATSSSTIPTCENPGANPPSIKLGSPLVGGERPSHCATASHLSDLKVMEWVAFDNKVLRADDGDVRILGTGEREIPEKTLQQTASSGTISTCENPGSDPPGIELSSAKWEASSLPTRRPRPRRQ